MTFKRVLAVASLTLGLIFIPVRVTAQSSQQVSPPQQNPQTNVSGNLQPTGSGLQTPTTNSSQTTSVLTQDQLTSSSVLRVLGSSTPTVSVQGVSTVNTTTISPTAQTVQVQKSSNFLWVIIPIFGLGFLAITYWQFTRPRKRYS